MKKLLFYATTLVLLALFQQAKAQLYIAPGETIYSTAGATLYVKEALADDAINGPGELSLTSTTLHLNPNADYATSTIIHSNLSTISTIGVDANRIFTIGSFDLQGNTTISLASNIVHELHFQPSGGYNWQGTLTITGWQGNYNGTTGTKGKVFFGSNEWGLESFFHVPMIKFFDGTYTYDAVHLTTGEIVPSVYISTSPNATLASSMCEGGSYDVNFTYNSAQNFGSSTTFTAQLSDATGSFSNPTSIGTVAGAASGDQNITVTIPSGLTGGAGYRIRVVSNTPSVTGSDNGTDIYIKAFSAGTISSTGESICSGASTSEITSTIPAEGGNNLVSYTWRSSADNYSAAIAGASSATYTPPSGLTAATSYRRYAADGECSTTPIAAIGTWTVGINISLAGTISGSSSVCSGSSTSLTLAGHSGSIQWQKSSSLNGTYTAISGATAPISSTGTLTADTYFRTAVTNGSCTTMNSDAFLVSVTGTLTTIPTVVGASTAVLGTTMTYSVAPLANAVSYLWDLPAGMTIANSVDNGATISVAIAQNYQSGIIKAKAMNACFSTEWQTKTVNAPGQVGMSIIGTAVVCGGTNNVTYSVPAVAGATYAWTLPAGLTFATNYDGDENLIKVNFTSGYESGAITCTRSTATATNTANYNVGGILTPVSIAGLAVLCDATTTTYSTGTVPNATSYQWQLPSGMSGSSTTNSITPTWTGSVSGTVKVRAVGTCGTSAWRTLNVGAVATPSGITGPTIICGAATYTITGSTMTQVSQTTLNYSVTNVAGLTYNWSVPTGMSLSSGQGTNAIVVEVDPAVFTSGQLTVTATSTSNNTCVSSARTLAVSKAVTSITGPTAICGLTNATYSVPSGSGSAYTWTLPSWMTLASGSSLNSNSINVVISASGTSAQTLSVEIVTGCGPVTVSRSVGCGLYTQLSSASCGALVSSFSTGIGANNIVGAQGYKFQIAIPSQNATTYYYVQSSDRWFSLSEATSMPQLYGTTYSIKVSLNLGNSWGDYGSACTVSTPVLPTTLLSNTSCGATLASFSSGISANNIQGTTTYRFTITPSASQTSYIVNSPDRWMVLSEAIGMPLLYGTAYSITVTLENGTGIWGNAGAACTVTTPTLPTTMVSNTFCGATLTSLSSGISANNVQGATMYEFHIIDGATLLEYTIQSPDRWITLSEGQSVGQNPQALVPTWDNVYTIKVKVQSGSAWSAYGTECFVNTAFQGLAQQDPQLHEEQSEGIQLEEVTNATQTAAGITETNTTSTWAATATSNPFATSFQVKLSGAEGISSDASFTAQLTDMSGKVYSQATLSKEQLEAESFGEQLAPGLYLMTLRQGEELRVLRVMKR